MTLTLKTAQQTVVTNSPVGVFKAYRAGRIGPAVHDFDISFSVLRDNGDCVVRADCTVHRTYAVYIGDTFMRTIPKEAVLPTAQLYLNAQRLRKTLKSAKIMVIRPVAA